MVARKAFIESREYERFSLRDGVVALNYSSDIKFGRIMNISLGGLSLVHFDGEDWESNSYDSEMILAGYDFHLDEIPARIVADIEVSIQNPYQEISQRQCSMEFGALTPKQRSYLQEIIRDHARGEDLMLRLPEQDFPDPADR